MKAKIKEGQFISHDFRYFNWPKCKNKNVNPDLIFDAEWRGNYWNMVASGFGIIGDYGNGSIFVHDKNGIIHVITGK